MKKVLALIGLTFLSLSLLAPVSFAQGTYSCQKIAILCFTVKVNCDDTFQAGSQCSNNINNCQAGVAYSCDPIPYLCNGSDGIDTALGCIPTDPQQFLQAVLPWAFGIAGTAAFLLIAFGAVSHITAAGNPEQLQHAREIIVSAIVGLIFVIFAVVLLRIIGVDILGLPDLDTEERRKGDLLPPVTYQNKTLKISVSKIKN